MVARRTFADIMDENEDDYNKRLTVPNTLEEKAKLQKHAQALAKDITQVLHSINR